ncbi:hypothetical protein [Ornithinibacillus sp. 179-J 7C1 HS]|uniref:hypothetical protein n=1 Tax=Ornithinibacillus sp. 179-J 7C1 HS TaxID=3142384 RepID=UPI0039A0F835
MWDRLVGLYLAAILAGFALANVPTSSIITTQIAEVLQLIGGLVIVVFAIAIVYLALKALVRKSTD